MTTVSDITGWLNRARDKGATHLIVVCDTFEYSEYPVMVMPGEDARKKSREYDEESMQRVMEVYNIGMDWAEQLSERRAFNF